MRGGVLPVAATAVCIGGILVWTMAAHDPYWRLFETSSLPAPAYESPEEIRVALATAAVVAPNPDSAAIRPNAASTGAADSAGPPVALLPRPAEPLIAVPVAVAPDLPSESPGLAPEATPDPSGPAPVIALAPPPLLLPEPLRAQEPAVAAGTAPAPVSAAEAPSPLWIAADEASEEVLALTRAQRADVQRRLALAGFDPRGFDGVFGPRTRQAIADFQAAWGFPATGYLDSAAHADLEARTDEAYAALASRAASEPSAAPALAPVARERQVAANETGGCARDDRGRIIERQSFGCDLKGLAEQVVSLGRNKLAHEEDGAVAVASGAAFATGAGR